MRVVVSGASGFIGSALTIRLQSTLGIDVIAVSRSGVDTPTTVCINDYRDMPAGDVLVHLAEDADRLRVNKAGQPYLQKTAATIDALLGKKYQRVIYGSSSVVYGEGELPFCEDADVTVTDFYTQNKLSIERKVIEAGGIAARFSNVIGFGMSLNNVVSDILAQIPGTGVLTVRNDKPVRDFVWQSDVVEALVRIIHAQCQGIFNVGAGVGVSINELASISLQLANESYRPVQSAQTVPSVSTNIVDITKMKTELDWSPQINIRDSISLLLGARASSNSRSS